MPSFQEWNNYDQKFKDIPSSILHKYKNMRQLLLAAQSEAEQWGMDFFSREGGYGIYDAIYINLVTHHEFCQTFISA